MVCKRDGPAIPLELSEQDCGEAVSAAVTGYVQRRTAHHKRLYKEFILYTIILNKIHV